MCFRIGVLMVDGLKVLLVIVLNVFIQIVEVLWISFFGILGILFLYGLQCLLIQVWMKFLLKFFGCFFDLNFVGQFLVIQQWLEFGVWILLVRMIVLVLLVLNLYFVLMRISLCFVVICCLCVKSFSVQFFSVVYCLVVSSLCLIILFGVSGLLWLLLKVLLVGVMIVFGSFWFGFRLLGRVMLYIVC